MSESFSDKLKKLPPTLEELNDKIFEAEDTREPGKYLFALIKYISAGNYSPLGALNLCFTLGEDLQEKYLLGTHDRRKGDPYDMRDVAGALLRIGQKEFKDLPRVLKELERERKIADADVVRLRKSIQES